MENVTSTGATTATTGTTPNSTADKEADTTTSRVVGGLLGGGGGLLAVKAMGLLAGGPLGMAIIATLAVAGALAAPEVEKDIKQAMSAGSEAGKQVVDTAKQNPFTKSADTMGSVQE